MFPERFFRILKTCDDASTSHFPGTEVFNEGWMLRLVLDAMQTLKIGSQPFEFLNGSRWFSETRLVAPFKPRYRGDPLGEGLTSADAVVGHIQITSMTRAGIDLKPDARQFVVAEAKMFSNLASGTKYARGYNQAARDVACMAKAIEKSRIPLEQFESVGFVLLAPKRDHDCSWGGNWNACLTPESIRTSVGQRIAAYEMKSRTEAVALREWELNYFLPLVTRLERSKSKSVVVGRTH